MKYMNEKLKKAVNAQNRKCPNNLFLQYSVV